MNPETEYREGLEELAEHYKRVLELIGEDTERDGLPSILKCLHSVGRSEVKDS